MSYDNDDDMWDWQGEEYSLEDNASVEMSKTLFNDVSENVEPISDMFNTETTPVKACGDLAYHVSNNEVMGKDLEQYMDPSSQVKRRRMLQFESELLDELYNDEMFLRSKETKESVEDAISEMSQWVAGFTEGTSGSSNECLDPSSERWIADCFNDADMHLCTEDISDASAASATDVQIDIAELGINPPEYEINSVKMHHVRSHQNVIFRDRKPYVHATPKLASSIAYPFAFIKPCGVHGDTTLKDINERIHNPPKPKPRDDPIISYPTSAFSGKPVVGKTKIHTEGGRGSITIMRTKG